MKMKSKLFLSFTLLFVALFIALFFLEEIVGSKGVLILLMGGSLLLALFLSWMIVDGALRPLRFLSEAASRVSEGKYEELHFPHRYTHRHDEVGLLTRSFEKMVEGLAEREKIRAILNKVVSKEIADEILKHTPHLGGEDRVVTILFCDIRNFSGMTESFAPQEVIALLNTFMTKMTEIIEGEGGIVDKYIGDGIMALFGSPVQVEDHAMRALSAAKIMIEILKQWNEEREKKGEERVEVGIGIHTGMVVAGNMGAEDRLNYTVLGSGVNLAARLCSSAAAGQILVSEYTLEEPQVKESFSFKPLPPLLVKGFSHPIKVFDIVGFKWVG